MFVMSHPPISIVPRVGRSWAMRSFANVVFPAPLCPTIDTNSRENLKGDVLQSMDIRRVCFRDASEFDHFGSVASNFFQFGGGSSSPSFHRGSLCGISSTLTRMSPPRGFPIRLNATLSRSITRSGCLSRSGPQSFTVTTIERDGASSRETSNRVPLGTSGDAAHRHFLYAYHDARPCRMMPFDQMGVTVTDDAAPTVPVIDFPANFALVVTNVALDVTAFSSARSPTDGGRNALIVT